MLSDYLKILIKEMLIQIACDTFECHLYDMCCVFVADCKGKRGSDNNTRAIFLF